MTPERLSEIKHSANTGALVKAHESDWGGYSVGSIRPIAMELITEIDRQRSETARLERVLLDGDGWRCDGCERVFGPDDPNHGEDCDLCDACASEARTETPGPEESSHA